MSEFGIVVIGRNEGERLKRCLSSLKAQVSRVVYVDSGSTDGSVAFAKSVGAEVIELDRSRPFTMALGRNRGLEWLLENRPSIEYVQFLDGDCEVVGGWIEKALAVLDGEPDVGVVFGRRRERFRNASIYNRMIDWEWDVPIGYANYCGGDSMMRVAALKQVGSFDPSLIAGEEPELSVRLRRGGWRLKRIDSEMTIHDAAVYRFGQWWRRAMRAGWTFAEGWAMHGAAPERHRVRESVRTWQWGVIIPSLAVFLGPTTRGLSLLLFILYPVQWLKIAIDSNRRGVPLNEAAIQGAFGVIGKFPEALGQIKYWYTRLIKGEKRLIEYK